MTRARFIIAGVPALVAATPRKTARPQTLEMVPYAPLAPTFSGHAPVFSTTVIVRNIRPPISVYVTNINVVQLTWTFLDHHTLSLNLDRMDGGHSLVSLRDENGKTGSLELQAGSCTRPPIGFDVVYPAEPKDHPFPHVFEPGDERFPARFKIEERPKSDIILAQYPTESFTIYFRSPVMFGHVAGFRVRLFDDRANSFLCEPLREIPKSEVPSDGVEPEPQPTDSPEYNYFAADVSGYTFGDTYAVQLVEQPDPYCDSPFAGFVRTPKSRYAPG